MLCVEFKSRSTLFESNCQKIIGFPNFQLLETVKFRFSEKNKQKELDSFEKWFSDAHYVPERSNRLFSCKILIFLSQLASLMVQNNFLGENHRTGSLEMQAKQHPANYSCRRSRKSKTSQHW